MGNTDSSITDYDNVSPEAVEILTQRPYGHRILGIQENSPCSYATIHEDIVPFLDFIVEANGQPCDKEDDTFVAVIQECLEEGKELELKLFNVKCKQFRKITCRPNLDWGGEGALGLTIKFDFINDLQDTCIHVLDVVPNSPADKAGLEQFHDFILGTPHYGLKDTSELQELVSENMETLIEVFVYSQETDVVRRVEITPSLSWFDANGKPIQSKGCLGCRFGHGYLHRLPSKTLHSPGKGRIEDYLKIDSNPPTNGGTKTHTQEKVRHDSDDVGSGVMHEVATPLGNGEIHGEMGSIKSVVVKLDWGLDHNATASKCIIFIS